METNKNDFIEAVRQTRADALRRCVHSTLPRRFQFPMPTLLLYDM